MSNAEFDRHAATYLEQHRQAAAITGEEPAYFSDYKMRDFAALLREFGCPADGRYLDFGSGIGASVAPFRAHLPQAQLVCADVSAESLEHARRVHRDAAEFVWMKDGALPFAPASFDGVFACCVLHHIPHEQHREVLLGIKQLLKPGGLLMVYEHNPFNPLTVRAVRNCPFDENAVLLTAGQLLRTCDDVGLRCVRRDYRVFFPAGLAALRPLENGLRWLPLGAQYFGAFRP